MTRLLVSVRDAREAAMAVAAGAGLVDAKDPARGALEPLPVAAVEAIVQAVAGRVPSSAVAGAGEPAAIAASAAAMAGTGVSFVKLGLSGATSAAGIAGLGRALAGRGAFVAVLFADEDPDFEMVPRLAAAGFAGAMLDTQGKDGRRLTDHLDREALAAFVAACRAGGLMSGLAGSLDIDDIDLLAPLAPDYLGFRGGLCHGGDRRQGLDEAAVRQAVHRLAGQRREATAPLAGVA